MAAPVRKSLQAVVPALQDMVIGAIAANGQAVGIDCNQCCNLAIMCSGTFVGINVAFEASLDATTNADGTWFSVQAVRTNANAIESSTGVLGATPGYAWELSVNGYARFRVRATAYTSGTQTWKLKPAPFASEPIPAAQISGTQPVSGTVTANIGTGSIAAGTNAVGDVGVQYRASSTGGASIRHLVAAASTNATNVKASAGRVAGWSFSNLTASWRYVKLHNTAGAPTAGAGVVMTIAIPPNGVAVMPLGGGSIAFATGIAFTTVTGAADTDAVAVAANDIIGDLFFA